MTISEALHNDSGRSSLVTPELVFLLNLGRHSTFVANNWFSMCISHCCTVLTSSPFALQLSANGQPPTLRWKGVENIKHCHNDNKKMHRMENQLVVAAEAEWPIFDIVAKTQFQAVPCWIGNSHYGGPHTLVIINFGEGVKYCISKCRCFSLQALFCACCWPFFISAFVILGIVHGKCLTAAWKKYIS